MAKKDNSENVDKENKSLKEQIELLKQRLKLQEESFDISTSAVDSLKEILGIQSRSTTFEKATLKANQDIANAIANQKTGLSDINTIQRQIRKNDDLIKKNRLIEKGLLSSIGGELSKNGKIIEGRIKKQAEQNKQLAEYNKKIEDGQSIDLASYNQLKQKAALNEQLISQDFSKLSSLEQQYLLTQQNTKALEKQQEARKAEKDIQKNLQSQLGFSGKIAETLGTIPGIGNASRNALEEVTEELNKQVEASGQLPSRWKTFGMLVGKTTKSLSLGFTDPVTIVGGLLNIFSELDSSAGEYAKSMNQTYSEALKTRKEMSDIALATGDSAVHSSKLMETQAAVGQALGTNAKLNKEDLVTMTKLTHQAGFTHEELMGVQKLSLINGKSLENNTSAILGGAKAYASRNKLVVNEKQILKDISKSSASLQLSLGGSANELARSAVQARQFGINLEQAEKMSESLLDFESSIENELSAELLTGKDLNLERARALALNGDAAAAAAEIASQVGSAAEFGKMNVIQQEALAKAIGMQREELAQSLIDREALAKLGAEEGQTALEAYQAKREAGMSEAEIAKELGDEQLAKQYEQQSIQEKFNDTMMELKEMLINEILPVFTTIGNFIREHLDLIKSVVKIYIALKAAQMGFVAAQKIAMALGKQQKALTITDAVAAIVRGNWSSVGITPVVGAGLAIAGIAAGVGALYAMTANDLMSAPPGYGQRTLLGPEGAIQLNDKDTVIAGTNLFGNDVKSEPNKPTQMGNAGAIKVQSTGGGDMAAVIAAINSLANRPINVSIDGKKVIEATTGAQPNTTGDESRKNSYKMS
jgi:uncharacterized membrane protein